MLDLQKRLHLTYLFVSHDLSVVKHISDRVTVMYVGKIVETATSQDLSAGPAPYTAALLAACRWLTRGQTGKWSCPAKWPAPPTRPPAATSTHAAMYCIDRCKTEAPAYREITPGHFTGPATALKSWTWPASHEC